MGHMPNPESTAPKTMWNAGIMWGLFATTLIGKIGSGVAGSAIARSIPQAELISDTTVIGMIAADPKEIANVTGHYRAPAE
jgi:hypothetical protein